MPVTSDAAPAEDHRARPAIIAALIVAVQASFVFCLGYPLLHQSPHGIPVGVAGPAAAVRQLRETLASRPGAFDVHAYPDEAAARAAIRDRTVYGAVAVTPAGRRLLVASAASPPIAAMLAGNAKTLGHGHPVPVSDIVPAPAKDPEETGSLTTLLPLILVSLVLGAAIGFTERRAWRRLCWCAGSAAAAGLAVAGVAAGLGTFTGSYLPDAGVLALLVSGLSACTAGLVTAKPLRPLAALLALTMIFIGIPSAGALVPTDMLAQPWRAFGPYLPPGAALNALRSITFFPSAAIGRPLTVLACWAAAGMLLIIFAPAANGIRNRHRTPRTAALSAG